MVIRLRRHLKQKSTIKLRICWPSLGKIEFNIRKQIQMQLFRRVKAQFGDLIAAVNRQKYQMGCYWKLDVMLELVWKNISARGVKVIWAETAEDALHEIEKYVKN